MTQSGIIYASAKRGSRTPTPFPALEPEPGDRFSSESENQANAEESAISVRQRTSASAPKWSRSKDTSKGTGIVSGGIELTERNHGKWRKSHLGIQSGLNARWYGVDLEAKAESRDLARLEGAP